MLIFVSYETKGLFGHYRTVINQLLSFAYGAVRYEIIQYIFNFNSDIKDWSISETFSSLKKVMPHMQKSLTLQLFLQHFASDFFAIGNLDKVFFFHFTGSFIWNNCMWNQCL